MPVLEGRGHLIQSRSWPKSHAPLCVQAMAEDLGDQDKAKQIQDQLNELEERAEALDRQRTKNISAIRCASGPVWIGLLSLVHSLSGELWPWMCYAPVAPHIWNQAPWFPPSFHSPLTHPSSSPHSYINQRNREWNIVESEKALVVSETA